jgi:AhpD family alkylhydroperoxidase
MSGPVDPNGDPMPFGELPDDVAERFRQREFVHTNFYRSISHHPDLTRTWVDFAFGIRDHATIPPSLRELMILRIAMLNRAPYAWHHHRRMGAVAGVTEEQVAELAMWESAAVFSPREKAALGFADRVVAGRDLGRAREALDQLFDRSEQVELMIIASFYVAVGRMLELLRVPIESEGDA